MMLAPRAHAARLGVAVFVAAVVGPGCTLFYDAEFPDGPTDPADTADVTDSDVGVDIDAVDDTDDADAPDTDTTDVPDSTELCPNDNCCGGASPLLLDGVPVEPGQPCDGCGVLVCAGPDAVSCVLPEGIGACGSCAQSTGASGDACGACGAGVLACDPGGMLACDGDAAVNACGGCGALASAPGGACTVGGRTGVYACSGHDTVVCVPVGQNACGGTRALSGSVGDPCGACGQGVLTCDGVDALRCADAGAGLNACGGCSPLVAAPGDSCGTCAGGSWACDGTERVTCQEPTRNACGGCGSLGAGTPGATCNATRGFVWACDGYDDVFCPEAVTNACGGTATLSGAPGSSCGACDDGYLVCATPDAVACVGATAANACGGCGVLAGAPGTACGARHDWTCTDEGTVACEPSVVRNACGGTEALAASPGDRCGACDSGVVACDGVDATRCIGEDPATEGPWFADVDRDGFAADTATPVASCTQPVGLVRERGDCDDSNPRTYPGAPELCDTLDNDCDTATADDGTPVSYYADGDRDGWGSGAPLGSACSPPGGSALRAGDCLDTDASVFPGAAEVCDGIDQDCDGTNDDGVSNSCGGCGVLASEPLEACGPCLVDVYVCAGLDNVACSGATACPPTELLTEAPTAVAATTATLNANLLTLGTPAPTRSGFCWGTARQPSPLNGTCTDLGAPRAAGPFSANIANLIPGTEYFVRAYIRVGGGDRLANAVRLRTATPAPSDVAATDGTEADAVRVTWTAAPGATAYEVYRDGESIARLGAGATAFDDLGASLGARPAVSALTASQGTSTDGVQLAWTVTPGDAGAAHVYEVRASYAVGTSPLSSPDVGFAGPEEIVGFTVYGDGEEVAAAATTSYFVVDAPLGTVVPGTVTASDGTDLVGVRLAIAGTAVEAPSATGYQVDFVGTRGQGAISGAASGFRGVGLPTHVWQRSSGDADAGYTVVPGSAGTEFTDTTAPVDGTGRYWRALITAPGAAETTSGADRGFRRADAQVTTLAPVVTGSTTATGRLRVTTLGSPIADAAGVCVGPAADVTPDSAGAVCVESAGIAVGDLELGIDGLAPGATLFARAFARSGANYAFGSGLRFEMRPAAPEGLAASDGTSTANVTLTWTATDGADLYRVFRDGAQIGTSPTTTFTDTGATAGAAPNAADLGLTATTTILEHVVVSWNLPATQPGTAHSYTVAAVSESGAGELSVPDVGFRAAYPVAGFDLEVDGIVRDMALGRSLTDTSALQGVFSAGTVSASDGTSSAFVALTANGTGVADAPARSYRVRARSAGGASDWTPIAQGRRAAPTVTIQWQRSVSDSPSSFSDLAGVTGASASDVNAPADGAGRFYRAVVTTSDGRGSTTGSDRGFRQASLPAVFTTSATSVTANSASLNGSLASLGTPAATQHGFCVGTLTSPARDDGSSVCSLLGAPLATGSFSASAAALNPATAYFVRAFATNSIATAYGESVSFTTLPAAPTGVSASDGTATASVTVSWTPVVGATSYTVLRDGVAAASVASPPWVDVGAAAGGAPSAIGFNVSASVNRNDRVRVLWTTPQSVNGTTYAYSVVAVGAGGSSVESASDSGFRAAPSITGYEVEVNGTWIDIGATTVYDDTSAPAPVITPGTVTASDATSLSSIALTASGISIANGAPASYRVRARNSVGTGEASGAVSGFRLAPVPTLQWQRSAGDADASYSDLPGLVSTPASDTSVPSAADGYFYRVRVSGTSLLPVSSPADRGALARLPAVAAPGVAGFFNETFVTGTITDLGLPLASSWGACIASTTSSPRRDDGQSDCASDTDLSDDTQVTVGYVDLLPGSYHAVTWIENSFGTVYSASTPFVVE